MGQMKPAVFQRYVAEARELGIDPYEAGEFNTDNDAAVQGLVARIEAARATQDADPYEYVEIQIIEQTEWIPGNVVPTGIDVQDPRNPEKTVPHQFLLHKGSTILKTLPNQKLIDVGVQGLGKTRIVEIDGEEGEDKQAVQYGLYLFQAVLARNVSADFSKGVMDGQLKPIRDQEAYEAEHGRDRRKDLVIVEQMPDLPNREERRGNKTSKGSGKRRR